MHCRTFVGLRNANRENVQRPDGENDASQVCSHNKLESKEQTKIAHKVAQPKSSEKVFTSERRNV